MSLNTLSSNLYTVKSQNNYKNALKSSNNRPLSMKINDKISFTAGNEVIRGAKGISGKWRAIKTEMKKSFIRYKNFPDHAINDAANKAYLILSKPVRETPIKLKVRGQNGVTEDANILCKKLFKANYFIIHVKDKLAGYVSIGSTKKAEYITYINTMEGRETYKDLNKILLQAVAEHRINKGQLPFMNGNALDTMAGKKIIPSENIHKWLGAVEVKGMGCKGYRKIGVGSEEQAVGIVKKLLEKNEFIFPETEQNARKLLAKYEKKNN